MCVPIPRVELKVRCRYAYQLVYLVLNARCGVESDKNYSFLEKICTFLLHNVELKVLWVLVMWIRSNVPNAPCGVERSLSKILDSFYKKLGS